jgi:CDP-6-deoxy-D-xylo-4-hexulose-3-dehydrase
LHRLFRSGVGISLRAHGWTRGLPTQNSVFNKSDNQWEDFYRFVLPGYNLRPLEISGAIGQIQLRKFPEFLQARRSNAKKFITHLSNSNSYQIQQEIGKSSWFGFSIVLKENLRGKRNLLLKVLEENNIDTRPIVAGNFTMNPVMEHLKFSTLPNLPNADLIHKEGFFIGNHHFDISDKLDELFLVLSKFEAEFAK